MTSDTRETDDGYTIRPFEPGDETAFVALYNEVWTADRTVEWFDWRYRDNPYVDEVPMFVADYDGDVVATRPFIPFRVRAGGETRLAFYCTDTMTDAAHRRKGLFARTTEHALARYAERSREERPAFFFNHSNEFSLPGYRKMGWEFASAEVRHHRLQRAGSYVADVVGGLPGAVGGRVATALTRGYLDLVDARASFDTAPFEVERFDGHESIPAAEFAACYDACRPDAVHVVYDEPFYEWYFAQPGHEADAAYLVRRDGRSVAGLVTDREHDPRNDTTAVTVSHVVPAAGGPERVGALAAAFGRLLADCADADVVRVANPLVPDGILRTFGFYPDDRLPMSKLAEPSGLTLGVRPLLDGEWELNGRSIRAADPYLWTAG